MGDLISIYGDTQSGNCYKLKLLTAILNIEHEWIHVDILAGDSKDESFLSLNPAGKIPLLVLSDGRCLSESNAILNFLAADSELLPDEPFLRAKVMQWQFFEQYSHEPYIAVARFIAKYLGLPEDRKAEYVSKQEGGNKALALMEKQLAETSYLVGESFSVADISLYAYTHVAEEGGFDLSRYPAIQVWLARISAQPNYTGMS
jgi:glutathione S-transferase